MKYALLCSSTGLFFNGTNFSADVNGAKIFDTPPNMTAVRYAWCAPVELVTVHHLSGWAFNR